MIRKLQATDKDIFIKMVDDFYHSDAVLASIPMENIHNTYEEAINESPYVKAYIIEFEGRVAGYGLVSISFSNEAGGLAIWLEEIYILDDYRGLGLGSQFLDFVKSEFESKAKRLRLEISANNKAAQRLYQHKGYIALDYLQMVYDL